MSYRDRRNVLKYPGIIYGHNEILKSTNAKYPFTNTDVKLPAIPAGNTSFSFDQLFNPLTPNKIVISFVSSKAVSCDYKLNPFNFNHYDLSEISLLVDRIPVGGNAMKINFNSSSGITSLVGFNSLFQASGKDMQDTGNGLDREDYCSGNTLYAFNIEVPEFEGLDYLTLLEQAIVRIESHVNNPIPEPCICVVYSENSAYFEVTQSRYIVLQ